MFSCLRRCIATCDVDKEELDDATENPDEQIRDMVKNGEEQPHQHAPFPAALPSDMPTLRETIDPVPRMPTSLSPDSYPRRRMHAKGSAQQLFQQSCYWTFCAAALTAAGVTFRETITGAVLRRYVPSDISHAFLDAMALVGSVATGLTLWQATVRRHLKARRPPSALPRPLPTPLGLPMGPPQTPVTEELEDAAWIQFFGKRQSGTLRRVHWPLPRPSGRGTRPKYAMRCREWWKSCTDLVEDPFLRVALRAAVGVTPPEICVQLIDRVKNLWEACDGHPLPDPMTWVRRPIYIRFVNPTVTMERRILRLVRKFLAHAPFTRDDRLAFPTGQLLVNDDDAIYPFETELFQGQLLIRVCNGGALGMAALGHRYFRGRKRLLQTVVQGTFKRRLAFNEVLTGQVWRSHWHHLPPSWILRMFGRIISGVLPAVVTNFGGPEPYLLIPLITACQTVHICDPRQRSPPKLTDVELTEDVRLLGAPFLAPRSGGRMDPASRRQFFSRPENLLGRFFEPGLVYTMEAYQHLFNVTDYRLHLPLFTLDITRYLNRQPVEINVFVERKYASFFGAEPARDHALEGDRQYLWRLQLCHEKLLGIS